MRTLISSFEYELRLLDANARKAEEDREALEREERAKDAMREMLGRYQNVTVRETNVRRK